MKLDRVYNLDTLRSQQAGMSLIELMVSLGVMGIMTMGMLSFFAMQNREYRSLQESLAKLDLESSLIKSFASSGICTFVLADPSQSATGSAPNRSKDAIDASSDTTVGATEIFLKKIPTSASITAESLVTAGGTASVNSPSLKVKSLKFINFRLVGVDQLTADFRVDFDPASSVLALAPIILKNINVDTKSADPINAKSFTQCGAARAAAPKISRISFTTAGIHSWVVPQGVTSAFVTIAGGGGSGFGWRVSNALRSGDSGGYVTSYPITLVPGETVSIKVGPGGIAFAPVRTSVPAVPGPPFFVYTQPVGDDGLGGYPGASSSITSPSLGTLIECAGGSGASSLGIDAYDGVKVAGNLDGATYGNGNPPLPSPSRKATGSYAVENAPGHCGAGSEVFGEGAIGQFMGTAHTSKLNSTRLAGGRTGMDFGSGGDVTYWGCYVTPTLIGVCVSPTPGKDGAVFIDVLN